jgi:hypothetical protein
MLAVGPPKSLTTPVKPGHFVADVFDFAQDRVFAAALDDAAFVLGDRAKRAAAETPAHDVDAETDHFPRRDLGLAIMTALGVGVSRVRAAGIRQVEHMVHLGCGERNGRRVDPHVASGATFAVRLHQGTGIAGVGLQVKDAVGVGVEHRVAFHLFVAGQADDTLCCGWRL